jgi:hypothetical protein
MSTGWVAAGVRAKAMARRRVGGGAARRAADAPDLPAALAQLAGTSAGTWLAGCGTVAQAEHAGSAELLWSMRVLAGWLPARGTGVLRALAAGFEAENLTAHAAALAGAQVPPPFELGALATAWPRARRTTSLDALRAALRTSPWGDPGPADDLPDVLGTSWLTRVAVDAPGTRGWARDAVALTLARRLLLGAPPAPRLAEASRRLVGTRWPEARSLDALRDALPRDTLPALAPVTGPADLWRAEAALRGRVQTEAFAMLREPVSPRVVVGAVAVLAVDTWRVVAALGAAAAAPVGGGGREVLDAAA